MKSYYGNFDINEYHEEVRSGKLMYTYGNGEIGTNNWVFDGGTYVVSVSCQSDTSVGNKLTTGDFQAKVVARAPGSDAERTIFQGNYSGNGAYDLSFTVSGIVTIDPNTSLSGAVQTGSTNAVGGGVKVTFRAVKVG